MEGLLWVYQNKHDIVPIHDKRVNEPHQKHTLYIRWYDNDDNGNDADDNNHDDMMMMMTAKMMMTTMMKMRI